MTIQKTFDFGEHVRELDRPLRCGVCGNLEYLGCYSVLGADDGCVICNACHLQVDIDSGEFRCDDTNESWEELTCASDD